MQSNLVLTDTLYLKRKRIAGKIFYFLLGEGERVFLWIWKQGDFLQKEKYFSFPVLYLPMVENKKSRMAGDITPAL